MKSSAHLVPSPTSAACAPSGRVSFAFGKRFFLALAIGLIWIGPAWWDARYAWGVVAWDLVVLAAWVWDQWRLPRPAELEIERRWEGPVALAAEKNGPSFLDFAAWGRLAGGSFLATEPDVRRTDRQETHHYPH